MYTSGSLLAAQRNLHIHTPSLPRGTSSSTDSPSALNPPLGAYKVRIKRRRSAIPTPLRNNRHADDRSICRCKSQPPRYGKGRAVSPLWLHHSPLPYNANMTLATNQPHPEEQASSCSALLRHREGAHYPLTSLRNVPWKAQPPFRRIRPPP